MYKIHFDNDGRIAVNPPEVLPLDEIKARALEQEKAFRALFGKGASDDDLDDLDDGPYTLPNISTNNFKKGLDALPDVLDASRDGGECVPVNDDRSHQGCMERVAVGITDLYEAQCIAEHKETEATEAAKAAKAAEVTKQWIQDLSEGKFGAKAGALVFLMEEIYNHSPEGSSLQAFCREYFSGVEDFDHGDPSLG